MTDAIQKQTEPEPVRIVTTSEDCAACSKSSDFLDVLITQAVGSQAISFVVEKDRGKYANAAASALMGIRPRPDARR